MSVTFNLKTLALCQELKSPAKGRLMPNSLLQARPYTGPKRTLVNEDQFVTAKLDGPLMTDALLTNAALALINPGSNQHYLANVGRLASVEQIKDSLAQFNLAKSKIYVFQGLIDTGAKQKIFDALSQMVKAGERMEIGLLRAGSSAITAYQGALFAGG